MQDFLYVLSHENPLKRLLYNINLGLGTGINTNNLSPFFKLNLIQLLSGKENPKIKNPA